MGGNADNGLRPIKRLSKTPKEMVRWFRLYHNGRHAIGDKNGWSHATFFFPKGFTKAPKPVYALWAATSICTSNNL
jgi:hypothetical protein